MRFWFFFDLQRVTFVNVSHGNKTVLKEIRSVLVIKPSSLGDVVHTLPSVRLLKLARPDLEIDWLVNTEWMPLLEGNTDLRRTIEFPRRKFRGLSGALHFIQWSQSLRDRRLDLVLDFQGLTRSTLCAKATGCRRVHCLSNAELIPRVFSTRVVSVDRDEHAVERYVRMVADLGVQVTRPLEFPLPAGTPPQGYNKGAPFVLVHPFSRGEGKSMPAESVERLCAGLAPMRTIIAGRAEETLRLPANAANYLNCTTLPELVWLIRRAIFTVSVDSGPMHIASALTDRLLAIHTWSDPRKVGPYNKDAWVWKTGRIMRAAELDPELAVQNAAFSSEDLPPLLDFLRREIAAG